MDTSTRLALRLGAAAALAFAAAAAPARTSVHVGIGVGLPVYGTVAPALPVGARVGWYGGHRYGHHAGVWYRPWGPRWVVVAPPVVVGAVAAPAYAAPAEPAPQSVGPSRPDPVIYPRHNQDAAQTELDRQECNRWATTQPQAVADASVFQRAVEACMDGRGYSMK